MQNSVTTNQIPKFNSTTGRALTNSGITIDASNNLVFPGTAGISNIGVVEIR